MGNVSSHLAPVTHITGGCPAPLGVRAGRVGAAGIVGSRVRMAAHHLRDQRGPRVGGRVDGMGPPQRPALGVGDCGFATGRPQGGLIGGALTYVRPSVTGRARAAAIVPVVSGVPTTVWERSRRPPARRPALDHLTERPADTPALLHATVRPPAGSRRSRPEPTERPKPPGAADAHDAAAAVRSSRRRRCRCSRGACVGSGFGALLRLGGVIAGWIGAWRGAGWVWGGHPASFSS